MSRPIEFRVWDTSNRQMCQVLMMEYWDPEPGGEYELGGCYLSNGRHYRKIEELVLLQYTGLRDCAGKKIFEGDILRIENATAVVVFWERPPEFGLNFHHNEQDWSLTDDHDRMEIIGNIYEHAKLLEKKPVG